MAAQSLEAEVAAVLSEGRVQACLGFAIGHDPDCASFEAAAARGHLDLEGVGDCFCTAAPLDSPTPSWLLVARSGTETFAIEELSLLRAMARSLGMTIQLIRVVDNERRLRQVSEENAAENLKLLEVVRERQDLLEMLAKIQRSISMRMPLDEMLASIVAGAGDLFGNEMVAIQLKDPKDPRYLVLMSSSGLSAEQTAALERAPTTEGAAGRAYREDRVILIKDYRHSIEGRRELVETGLVTAMTAPLHENGKPVGCIGVGSTVPGREYSQAEQEVLLTFAEHASIALADARMVAAMEHQAFHDSLTDLPNRALFLDRLGQALRRSRRELAASVAVLFIDLDRFKSVNDSLGHAAGDALLAEVGSRLLKSVREVDTAARLGGDEFAVLVEEGGGMIAAAALAERLQESLRSPFSVEGKDVSIAAAIGVAVSTSGHEEADELLRNADLAMYQAKVSGSGRSRVYEPSMHAAVIKRLDLESEITRGIDAGEFVVHYQPQIELKSGRVVGVEALVRWQHPSQGLIYPGDFIEVAEETGLIVPLGRLVLEQAAQMSGLLQAFTAVAPFGMSVNLSVRQVQRVDLVDEVEQVLRAASIDPASFTLEVTESILLQDTDVTVEQLSRLRRLGVKLAIDDFGTGYSSLGYLRRFPIDVLKIDRSFVNGVGQSAQESALTGAIIALASTLGLTTIAEGIERPEQLEELIRMNCPFGQGFHFSPALPASRLTSFLKHQKRAARLSVV